MEKEFGIAIDDSSYLWTEAALAAVAAGLGDLQKVMNKEVFAGIIRGLVFTVDTNDYTNGMAHRVGQGISVGSDVLTDEHYIRVNTVHEVGHRWDWLSGIARAGVSWWQLEVGMN